MRFTLTVTVDIPDNQLDGETWRDYVARKRDEARREVRYALSTNCRLSRVLISTARKQETQS